jgi:hypothetical protein
VPDLQILTEARATLLAEATGTPGWFRVQLIDAGWGTTGHYSQQVLTEAANRKVFHERLQMFADHARGDGSGVDHLGNRSVTDLWAVLATDATVDATTGALVAEAQVFGPYRELVADMADSIGRMVVTA